MLLLNPGASSPHPSRSAEAIFEDRKRFARNECEMGDKGEGKEKKAHAGTGIGATLIYSVYSPSSLWHLALI